MASEKSAFAKMLRCLSRAARARRPSEAHYLVEAHAWAAQAGSEARSVAWDLEGHIVSLIRKHAPRAKEIRKQAREVAREWDLELPLPGIGNTQEYPIPEQLVRIVKRLYPPKEFPRVADVAGGSGRYAKLLVRAGYQVTIIDPKGSRDKRLRVRRKKFRVDDADGFDLVFAYRPCGASQTVARAARRRPVVLIPCLCSRVWPGQSGFMVGAERFLKKIRIPYRRKGTVIFTGERALERGAIQKALAREAV